MFFFSLTLHTILSPHKDQRAKTTLYLVFVIILCCISLNLLPITYIDHNSVSLYKSNTLSPFISPSSGTIVKARDKLYHPECFMCDDCGINLKQRGYFFIEDNLYCETHAKARVQPPEGYDVVAVYPNSKVELV